MMRLTLPILLAFGVTGCTFNPHVIGKAPEMTPVGAGLTPAAVPIRTDPKPIPQYRRGNSLWQDSSADLFSDPRANKVGDIITVKISIKDKASFDTKSNRSRNSEADLDASFAYDFETSGATPNVTAQGSGSFTPAVKANTESDSKGGTSRAESIQLLIAAIVTGVLPNGNLMISGTQEVRVNYEVRELNVAGVVRPGDVATDNTISYDKIAEARISYGGRGRIMEVQQPGWGQQLIDSIAPY